MFDAVAVTGHHKDRVVEYVDHLHEHFKVPTQVRGGYYLAPTEPGAGAEMHQSTIDEYEFPTGNYWKKANKK